MSETTLSSPSLWRQYRDLPRAVHILCLGTLVNRSGTFLLAFLTLYVRQLGESIEVATRAMGAWGVGAIVASLVGGHLADRFGRRVVMVGSLVGGGAVLVLFGALREPWAIVGAVFLFGLLSDMYRPAASAMVADLVGPDLRPQAYGLMYVAVNLGFTVGAVLGGVIARYSFQWLFWGDALTACAYAVLIMFALPETLPGHGSSANGDDSVSFVRAAIHIARDRIFLLYCAATLLAFIVFMQILSSFPLQLREHGIGTDTYGLIIAINGAMIVFLQLPVTSAVTRYDRGRVLAVSALLTAVGFGAVGLSAEVWQFALLIVVITTGELIQAPLMQAIVGDLAPAAMRGRYMGVLSVVFGIALMIGAPAGGWVLDNVGSGALWGGCFVSACLAAVLFLSIRHRIVAPPAER